MSAPTPHISAQPGQIARTVLMPGDPLRSRFIAEHYLLEPQLVNDIRGVQGYTGLYHEQPVTVMASGMGIPSMAIYSYELFNFYDVERIIRIGSAGALQDQLKLRDIVFGQGACTTSRYAEQFGLNGTFAPLASWRLLQQAVRSAQELGLDPVVGNLLSSDVFYDDDPRANDAWRRMGVLAVEMEAAGLYLNAARAGKEALCICTISDHLYTGEKLDALSRQNSFSQMIELALQIAVDCG